MSRPAPQHGGPRERREPVLGVVGPRRAAHMVRATDLAAIQLPVSDDGVLIGSDATDGSPAVLGLFARSGRDVILVGGAYAAQLIALRAVAAGARVAIETGRPHIWEELRLKASSGQECVTVHPVNALGPQGASVHSPVLVIRDCGAIPPRVGARHGAWQTTLTLLPYLDPASADLLGTQDMVGLQRISPPEAGLAAAVLSLPSAERAALPTLADSLTLWVAGFNRRYVQATPTSLEDALLGQPRRIDG